MWRCIAIHSVTSSHIVSFCLSIQELTTFALLVLFNSVFFRYLRFILMLKVDWFQFHSFHLLHLILSFSFYKFKIFCYQIRTSNCNCVMQKIPCVRNYKKRNNIIVIFNSFEFLIISINEAFEHKKFQFDVYKLYVICEINRLIEKN